MLNCIACGNEYPLESKQWRCSCGGVFDIEGIPDLKGQWIDSKRFDIWRYRRGIFSGEQTGTYSNRFLTLGEGWTPLVQNPLQWEHKNTSAKIFLKYDHMMPTGSFKDRGSAVLLQYIRSMGITEVVEDSSGNAGASIAAYSAAADIESSIFVPDGTMAAKTAQIEAYGAKLIRVPGSREDTAAAALSAAEETYYASHSWNPFFFQGTKTAAFEIAEQLDWNPPDTMIAPCGNGTLVLGLAAGFRELHANGIISRVPKLIAVQAEKCAPVFTEFQKDENYPAPREPKNQGSAVAPGIAVARPVRLKQILSAVTESGGWITTVTDEEILLASAAAWQSGLYIEETSAVALAALGNYLDFFSNNNEVVIAVLTGHGLKRAIG